MSRRLITMEAPRPPAGLDSAIIDDDGEEYLVLSFDARRPTFPDSITDAERSVAYLLLAGLSNVDIAHARGRSARTIANQIASLFGKFGVNSRTELVAKCRCAERRQAPAQHLVDTPVDPGDVDSTVARVRGEPPGR